MSFIDKDERITSWQTKTRHNFIETSVTASFLSSFFPSRFELFCSMAHVSCVNKKAIYPSLISFFLATKICIVYNYFCFTELQWAGFRTLFQCEVWTNMFAAFLQPWPTCRASDASATYKIILFPWRYTRPFWLQTANHCLTLKAEDIPRNCIWKEVRTKLF